MSRCPGYVALALIVCLAGCQQSPAPGSPPADAPTAQPAAQSAPMAAPQEPAGPSRLELIETLKSSEAMTARADGGPAAAQGRGNSLLPVLKEAKSLAGEVQRLDQEYAELQVKAKAHLEVVAQHNANQCKHPAGHPEACADYTRRAALLNTETTRLWNAMDRNEKSHKTATDSLERMKPRLRIAALFDGDCNLQCGGSVSDMLVCLNKCFDGVNPGLRSCLAVQDAALAACLLGQ